MGRAFLFRCASLLVSLEPRGQKGRRARIPQGEFHAINDQSQLVKFDFDKIQKECVNMKNVQPVPVHTAHKVADFRPSLIEERIYILTSDFQVFEQQTNKSKI